MVKMREKISEFSEDSFDVSKQIKWQGCYLSDKGLHGIMIKIVEKTFGKVTVKENAIKSPREVMKRVSIE